VFRIPQDIHFPDEEEPRFGDERPSELLDAGEWLWLAELMARNTPAEPKAGTTTTELKRMRIDLRTAAAAVAEAMKFVPADGESVPRQRHPERPRPRPPQRRAGPLPAHPPRGCPADVPRWGRPVRRDTGRRRMTDASSNPGPRTYWVLHAIRLAITTRSWGESFSRSMVLAKLEEDRRWRPGIPCISDVNR
jgi:hypothetical protein